jgi:NAD(P)-dependent dehydrogenase (short-subunit alcohol dehydrogenase family)
MSKPIAFIIGAGKNIGAGVANALQSKGYRIALAARSLKPEDSTSDRLLLPVDLSNAESIAPAFASLRKQWGEPSVVFYNGRHPHSQNPIIPSHHLDLLTRTTAAAVHFADPSDPLSPSVADFTQDLTINTISLYATIKESLSSFESLPNSAPGTFLYTGNSLNVKPQPAFTTLGVGKTASAHVVELASGAYGGKGYK